MKRASSQRGGRSRQTQLALFRMGRPWPAKAGQGRPRPWPANAGHDGPWPAIEIPDTANVRSLGRPWPASIGRPWLATAGHDQPAGHNQLAGQPASQPAAASPLPDRLFRPVCLPASLILSLWYKSTAAQDCGNHPGSPCCRPEKGGSRPDGGVPSWQRRSSRD